MYSYNLTITEHACPKPGDLERWEERLDSKKVSSWSLFTYRGTCEYVHTRERMHRVKHTQSHPRMHAHTQSQAHRVKHTHAALQNFL